MSIARVWNSTPPTTARRVRQRGAAFLLSVYIISLMLLILCAAALQMTTTEVRAAELYRDQQQSFWAAEAALDETVATMRVNALGSLDELGCTYGMVQLSSTAVQRGDYMVCNTADSALFQLELRGLDANSRAIWISSLLEKQDQQFVVKSAVVGLDGITVTSAKVGGVNTKEYPITLDTSKLTTDGFGDYLLPAITSFNSAGNLVTAAAQTAAITIQNGSQVYGEVTGGSQQAVSVASDSAHGGEIHFGLTNAAVVSAVTPVGIPSSAKDLGTVLLGVRGVEQ